MSAATAVFIGFGSVWGSFWGARASARPDLKGKLQGLHLGGVLSRSSYDAWCLSANQRRGRSPSELGAAAYSAAAAAASTVARRAGPDADAESDALSAPAE